METGKHRRRRRSRPGWYLAAIALFAAAGWAGWRYANDLPIVPEQVHRVAMAPGAQASIVEAAHAQEGDAYDASYRQMPYPNGDVPSGKGACTDVVVRALRKANIDLQKLVHEDVRAAPNEYRIARPDPNIDHRRVLNLMVFFGRHGETLPMTWEPGTKASWQPGDIVCWRLSPKTTHIGVISDGVTSEGRPLVIHNGWQAEEGDVLCRWRIIGHYRYPPR